MFERFAHITPGYVTARLRQMAYQWHNPESPWLTPAMVAVLSEFLRSDDTVFEWGSGRSTCWFARRVTHVVTVEENEAWVRQVKAWLEQDDTAARVELYYRDTSGRQAQEYVDVIDGQDDDRVDIVLVDGTLRDACALKAIPKIAPGGALVVDNIERYLPRHDPSPAPNARSIKDGYASDAWQDFHDRVRDWRLIWTTDGVTDTAMWIKPS